MLSVRLQAMSGRVSVERGALPPAGSSFLLCAMDSGDKKELKKIGLPERPFLYTVDQLSVVLEIAQPTIMLHYLYFDGRSTGIRPKDRMMARNISPVGVKPEWRVAEKELVRWMRTKGFRYYERNGFAN